MVSILILFGCFSCISFPRVGDWNLKGNARMSWGMPCPGATRIGVGIVQYYNVARCRLYRMSLLLQ